MFEDGIKILKKFISICGRNPGIYKMIGEGGRVLYIGKAKNLKSRLSDYLQIDNLSYKNKLCIANIKKIETISTNNEVEAILLESNLVHKLQPKYNILLKDDKSFPYIFIDETTDYPRIVKYRGKKDLKGHYFGPFASAAKAEEIIAILQKAFLIRTCTDAFFNSRKRPCILHQIKKCSAPCVGKISKDDYSLLVKQVKAHLSGKDHSVQKELTLFMEESSKRMDYERSAIYRDRLEALSAIQNKQVANLSSNSDFDIVAIYSDNDIAVIEIFFIRDGINLGNVIYNLDNLNGSSVNEIMSAFLFSFYKKHKSPNEILLSHEMLEKDMVMLKKFLYEEYGVKSKINYPSRGVKKDLLKFAENNVRDTFRKRYHDNKKHQNQFSEIQKLFKVSNSINRIEIYDNSHFAGDQAVGVMVVCDKNGLNKSEYRKYKIRTLHNKPDDYEMFREILRRRFKNLSNTPELIIMDGGAGQVSAAKEICVELGLNEITVVGMAKGPNRNSGEEIIHLSNGERLFLNKNEKLKQYLQLLRDEAHRFAITFQRKSLERGTIKSTLDEIPGIGPKRRKSLINYFGSVDNLKQASIEEITKVDMINKKNAEKIYKYFHNYL